MTARPATSKRGLPILTYHSLDETGSVISTPPALFRKQVAWLAREGFRTISLGEAIATLEQKGDVPDRTIALTFDDGYRNVYTEAFPALVRLGFSATVFLVTGHCGGYNDWPGPLPPNGRQPLVTWAQIREMSAGGIEFGSHTVTHPDLTRLAATAVESELIRSKEMIEESLGVAVDLFAYPYGRYDATVREAARSHYRAAFTTRLGEVAPRSDLYTLRRIDTYFLRPPLSISALRRPGFVSYLALRQIVRDLKDAIA